MPCKRKKRECPKTVLSEEIQNVCHAKARKWSIQRQVLVKRFKVHAMLKQENRISKDSFQ